MSFGVGVGDVLAISQLAWTVYKSCKEAPEHFGNIASDVLSLHAVLKEAEEEFPPQSLSWHKAERFQTILGGCNGVLNDIQTLVMHYHSLGTQSKRVWDRLSFSPKDATELRARLTANVTMLSAFISTNSQSRIEIKLDRLAKEFREGKREGSIMSVQTVDSLNADDKQTWREIRKELENIGISMSAFETNKGFILQWLDQAMSEGKFDEQQPPSFMQSQPLVERSNTLPKSALEDQTSEVSGATIVNGLHAPSHALSDLSLRGSKTLPAEPTAEPKASSGKMQAPLINENSKSKTRAPRLFKLVSRLGNPGRKLIRAAENGDLATMESLSSDNRTRSDTEAIEIAFFIALRGGPKSIDMVKLLLANGASFNNYNKFNRRWPLLHALEHNDATFLQQLIDLGAGVNDPDEAGQTAIFHCVLSRSRESHMKVLLGAGANPNHRNLQGLTPLKMSVANGQVHSAQILLQYGAKLEAKDSDGNTALAIATLNAHVPLMEMLLGYGASANNCKRGDPLLVSSMQGNSTGFRTTLALLNSTSINLDAVDSMGRTALHYVANASWEDQSLEVADKLLRNGASTQLRDIDGYTPLDLAEMRGWQSLCMILRNHGAADA